MVAAYPLGLSAFGNNPDRRNNGGRTATSSAATTTYGLDFLTNANANTIDGNYIGVNAAGTAALANGIDGIIFEAGVHDNIIGGATAGAGNVISGNTSVGVELRGTGTTGNVVAGNFIGTSAAGTAAIANAIGVEIDTSCGQQTPSAVRRRQPATSSAATRATA